MLAATATGYVCDEGPQPTRIVTLAMTASSTSARSRRRPASAAAACLALAALLVSAAPARARGRFAIPATADQLVVVSSPTYNPPAYLATLRTYERNNSRSPETGSGHLRAVRREGDGSTPTGVFGFGATMYGTEPDPGGLHYAYHRLACGDWWDEDPYSPRYNRFVHVPCGSTPSFASWSEALWTGTVAYPYFAVIEFNTDPIVGGASAPGSGIFLHSWIGSPTQGCVALPESRLLEVLCWLDPSAHPVIEIGARAELTPLG
jgi:L,D-peptidoglycan transpeptidase YkuD (ErfK/YbiS/YcfS/YnhG family)